MAPDCCYQCLQQVLYVLKICMQHTDESNQCRTTSNQFGVEAGVFGAEASTPPTPLDHWIEP